MKKRVESQSRLLTKAVCRLVKKISEARLRPRSAERRAKNRSFDLAQDRLSGDVPMRYVGATPLGAGMIPVAIERNYPKRLLKAGWWHMSLFQQPASVGPAKQPREKIK